MFTLFALILLGIYWEREIYLFKKFIIILIMTHDLERMWTRAWLAFVDRWLVFSPSCVELSLI